MPLQGTGILAEIALVTFGLDVADIIGSPVVDRNLVTLGQYSKVAWIRTRRNSGPRPVAFGAGWRHCQ